MEPHAGLDRRGRRLHHPGLRRVHGAVGLSGGVVGDGQRRQGGLARGTAARCDRGGDAQLELRDDRRPDGGSDPADAGGGGAGPGAGDGAGGRERRLPFLHPGDDAGGRVPRGLRGGAAGAARDPSDDAGVRGERAEPEAAVGAGAGQSAGQGGLEARHLPLDAGRRGRPGRVGGAPAGPGAGAGGGVQQGAQGGLRPGPALPLRRERGVRLPVRHRPAEPLGLVPPQQGRPGAARGDRLPDRHRTGSGALDQQ
ncbi:hypothetical protein SGPA1_30848 [Streptomyces misionensis JCM 4497]